MKKRKIWSLLLSLSILLSLALPATTAYAVDGSNDSGMEISKTAVQNSDGSYTITLEAYATGSKVISEITKDVPTDIVLVLDQSGSMADDIGQVVYEQYKDTGREYRTRNQDYYKYRHNGGSGNLWYKLSDGSYVSVSVTKTTGYTALNTELVNYDTSWGDLTTDCYYYYANNLFEKVGTEYKPVQLERSGDWRNGYIYTYTFSDGTTVDSAGNDAKADFGSRSPLYTLAADGDSTVYTYTYTDASGNVQTIGTSTGASTRFTPAFYRRTASTSGGGSRLAALKTAVTNFANAVNEKAKGEDGQFGTADDINHRIAVVGFASESGFGNNTELLSISGSNSGSVGVAYGNITNQNLKDVLQSMDTAAGRTMVSNAINALAAEGATRTDLGVDMAKRILNANPVPSGEKRNRVVIVFTDGVPTTKNTFNTTVANSALNSATEIKNNGTTVYSIGIFSGADATSSGNQNGNETQKANWFMQKLSSNNGTPQTPSYYLSASDADSLNSIFQQISDQIETGGASTTLDENTVIRDIIAPAFALPVGSTALDITLKTFACTGKNGDAYLWSENFGNAMGAAASISGDQVSVTGFDFAENYVGTVSENGNTTYHGNKLVISFTVDPRPGFLGGNGVYTNTGAGVYENSTSPTPVIEFERPKVDVPIPEIEITAEEKNVYLLGSVTKEQLLSGTTFKAGGVTLDPAQSNYGLEEWQTEYVNISLTLSDKNGNPITAALTDLEDDQKYTVTLTIKPKNRGTVTEQSGSAVGQINVFKPELTYKDGVAYYGATAPNNAALDEYLTKTAWKHNGVEANPNTMIGKAPELTKAYAFESSKIAEGKINTKQDIGVNVYVKIGDTDVTEKTTFVHTPCVGMTCDLIGHGNAKFLLHIKTCTLTITKTGGAANEPYVFTVYKDDEEYSEVTIVGNGSETLYELPVGSYTIKEDTGWSWRYTATIDSGAVLTASAPDGAINCTNTKTTDYWLNGFSQVVKNIFGVKH